MSVHLNRTIEFDAIPSGDHECFTFAVDLETFIRLTGNPPERYDKCCFNEGMFRIYPDRIFEDGTKVTEKPKKMHIQVTMEIL